MRRFFCENCGEEVEERQDVCPHCGAIFTAIKCPQCGYRGKFHEFFNGCPSCGFLGEERVQRTAAKEGIAHSAEALFIGSPTEARKRKKERPPWLFWLAIGVLFLSFVVLSIIYMRL